MPRSMHISLSMVMASATALFFFGVVGFNMSDRLTEPESVSPVILNHVPPVTAQVQPSPSVVKQPLKVDRNLRLFFEHEISQHRGDEAGIRKQLQIDLSSHLNDEDVQQAMRIFENYQRYEHAAAGIEQQESSANIKSAQDIQLLQHQMDILRAEYLGSQLSDQLFPSAHQLSDMVSTQMNILQDHSLDPKERIKQLMATQVQLQAFAQHQDALSACQNSSCPTQ
ncbi:MAG: hypothetical protein HKM02_11460 [Pseudomonadales bacterium]|nr:hypothetical protein [Pseudomonadales bacterium]